MFHNEAAVMIVKQLSSTDTDLFLEMFLHQQKDSENSERMPFLYSMRQAVIFKGLNVR